MRCSRGFIVVATVNAVNFVDGLDGLAAGVVGIGALAFFLFCYQLANLNGVAGDHGRAAVRGAGRRLRRVPAAQLPPRPAVHGRQRLDAARAGAVRSALTLSAQFSGTELSQGAAGSQASLLATLLPLLLPI